MQYAEDKTTKSRPNQSIVFCVYTGSCKCRVEGQCDFGGECRHKNDFRVDLSTTKDAPQDMTTESIKVDDAKYGRVIVERKTSNG